MRTTYSSPSIPHLMAPAGAVSTLLALALALPAADQLTNSARLSLTMLPSSVEVERSGLATDKVDWDSAGRLALGGYFSGSGQFSGYIGAGLTFSGYQYEEQGVELNQTEFGVFIEPGLVARFHENFALELGVPLGLGIAQYEQKMPDVYLYTYYDTRRRTWVDVYDPGWTTEATGIYAELGLVLRPVVQFNRFLVFGELGVLGNVAAYAGVEDKYNDGTTSLPYDVTVSTSGAFFSLGIGLAF
ncbi:MAG: hypothetical protein N3B15_09265 [Planctomycetota bacterium]|nr:hypothetical protein [Planctomycetota bacterium]